MILLRAGRLLSLLILVTAGFTAQAAVVVDSTSSASANSQTVQWSHTVGAGFDRLLVVGVSIRGSSKTVGGITYAGQSLTSLGARSNGGNQVRTEIWYLIAPASGTGTIAVSLSAKAKFSSGAVSFTGVLQSDPVSPFVSNASTGQGFTDPTLSMSGTAGETVLDVLAVEGGSQSLTPGTGQTELWDTPFGGAMTGAASMQPGSSSNAISWSKAKKGRWALGATSIRPATGFTGLLVSSNPILPGGMVTLTLTDPDLDTDPGVAETLTLNTTSTATGEVENLTYTETGLATGLFAAMVATVLDASVGADNDGVFHVQEGDVLETVYLDALTASGGTAVIIATSTVVVAELTLTKTVSAATALPGETLTYALVHVNTGPVQVFPTFTIDPIPADTDYQLGSATFQPGTSGLTAVIEFSNDGGSSYGYPPVSGGGGAPTGFDGSVTHVRYSFSGALSNQVPDNRLTVQLGVRVR